MLGESAAGTYGDGILRIDKVRLQEDPLGEEGRGPRD